MEEAVRAEEPLSLILVVRSN